jgi:hypothetical protein
MSSLYARVKNTVKGEEEVQDGTEQDYWFFEEVNTSIIYESQHDTL